MSAVELWAPRLTHNLDPRAFMWLWARYVTGYNPENHCTNALRGPYSRVLSAHNPRLCHDDSITLDEAPVRSYAAIYLCGVARSGYASKKNYAHNLHAVIRPLHGEHGSLTFEHWELRLENGRFEHIPSFEELPTQYASYSSAFTSCRIFRWAVVAAPTTSPSANNTD